MESGIFEDVTQEAVWEVSSAKPGTGVGYLIDNRPDTFWQSDHYAPHSITATFKRCIRFARVELLLNYLLDDSYTPKVIQIRLGLDRDSLTVRLTVPAMVSE